MSRRRKPPQEEPPLYGGCADALWIAMITSRARADMTLEQQDQFEFIIEQHVVKDLSPNGFIASGNRQPVHNAIDAVLGPQWLAYHDWLPVE